MLFFNEPVGLDEYLEDFSKYENQLKLLDDIFILNIETEGIEPVIEFKPVFKKTKEIKIKYVGGKK